MLIDDHILESLMNENISDDLSMSNMILLVHMEKTDFYLIEVIHESQLME